MHSRLASQRRLILFGRYPVPGHTKTRLIPTLGALGAAELQRWLTEKSLVTAMAAGLPNASLAFCYTGGDPGQVKRWLGLPPDQTILQRGSDLGARMRAALFDAIDQGCRQAVLVGTDIPGLTAGHLDAAFDALNRHDLVLGPSEDGGYWLVGLRCKAELFQGIAWGTANVLSQTLAAAKKLGLSSTCLPALHDLDTADDLIQGLSPDAWRGPYLSVVIPTLNEEDAIASAIQSARSPESEVIVADGGSRDRTIDIARACGATVIAAPRGRARQQNAGAARARGKVLLFLHADTVLPANYGLQVFEALLDSRAVAGAFQFRTDYVHWGMRLIEKTVRLRSARFQIPYGDQALFMPKAVFEKAGGFPQTPVAEDLYLARRLGRLGRIVMAPGFAVTSGRRWQEIGVWRAALINYLIAIGCLAGADPRRLAPLYRWWVNPRSMKR